MAVRHVVAGLVVAIAALFAAPVAANAQTYVPTGGCSLAPATISAGGHSTYTASAGTFGPSSHVDFSITGTDAAHASLSDGGVSGTGDPVFTTNSTGATTVSISLPADASGQYQITGTQVFGGVTATCTCTLTVLAHTDAVVTPALADPTDPSSSNQLAHTGEVVYTSIGWVGGGIILAGIALLIWRRLGRRRSAHHA